MRVLDPTFEETAVGFTPSPRLEDLSGTTVGIISNGKEGTAHFFAHLERIKHRHVKGWLERHPRFHAHFIPTSSSWLNLVERFFREITDRRIRRGIFRSVRELTQAIYDFLQHHNDNPRLFVWTKTADQILNKLAPSMPIGDHWT